MMDCYVNIILSEAIQIHCFKPTKVTLVYFLCGTVQYPHAFRDTSKTIKKLEKKLFNMVVTILLITI